MTLDEAIKHEEEVAEEYEKKLKVYENIDEDRLLFIEEETECRLCAEEHRQLAEWLRELKQLREQSRWIPVSERLPEYDEDIIITHKGAMGQPITSVSYFDGDFRTEDGEGYFSDVVAWMPLPEPYES